MRRADRLFQIVQHLRSGRLLTAGDLSERLEVSSRTIYRDIADLIGSGVPIEGEAGVGYLMRDGYDLPPLMFSSDEITALVAGARLMRAWGGAAMALSAENALEKIETVLPDDLRSKANSVHIHALNPRTLDDATRELIDQLDHHADQRNRLKIQYLDQKGAETNRVLRPLGLWYWGTVWTLVAWCELRSDFRMFRIDRIEGVENVGPFENERGKSLQDFFAQQAGCEETT